MRLLRFTCICILVVIASSKSYSLDSIPIDKVPIPKLKNRHHAGENKGYPIELSLTDSVFLGIRNNRTIKSTYLKRISEKFDLKVAENRFTPQFSLDGSLSRQRISSVNSNEYTVSPGISLLTPYGTSLDFAWNVTGSSSKGVNRWSNTVDLSIEQPLLRGGGLEVNMAPVRSARLQERINSIRLKTTISEIIGSIILSHRDLFQAQEELRLAKEAVSRGEEMLTQNKYLIQAGRMAEVDSVQTEADLESQKLRVLQALQLLKDKQLVLLDLLDLDLSMPITAKTETDLKYINMDISYLFETALANREDYQGQLFVLEQNKLGIKVAENEQLWDISLFARGTYGRESMTSLPDRTIADGVFGIKLSIPFNDLSRKKQLVQADTTFRSAELQLDMIKSGIERQIRTSAMEVEIYWQQANIAGTSLALARRALDVEKAKLNAGRSSTFQVRSMEQNLRDAEIQHVNAKINYLNALTRLDLQLGTTMETWQVALNDGN